MTESARQAVATKAAAVQDELLVDGSMVLYHTGTWRIVTLNPTAALIWECCDGAHTVPMIADELRAIFADEINAERDVLRLLGELREQGMIVMGDAGARA